jgi:hypothetical protein
MYSETPASLVAEKTMAIKDKKQVKILILLKIIKLYIFLQWPLTIQERATVGKSK